MCNKCKNNYESESGMQEWNNEESIGNMTQ